MTLEAHEPVIEPGKPKSAAQVGEGLRYDEGKWRTDLVPPEAVIAIAEILRHGVTKYAERNWEKGMAWQRCYASAMRHLLKWEMGGDLDGESGLPHLWHALTNLAFLVTYEARSIGADDRPRKCGLSVREATSVVMCSEGPFEDKHVKDVSGRIYEIVDRRKPLAGEFYFLESVGRVTQAAADRSFTVPIVRPLSVNVGAEKGTV